MLPTLLPTFSVHERLHPHLDSYPHPYQIPTFVNTNLHGTTPPHVCPLRTPTPSTPTNSYTPLILSASYTLTPYTIFPNIPSSYPAPTPTHTGTRTIGRYAYANKIMHISLKCLSKNKRDQKVISNYIYTIRYCMNVPVYMLPFHISIYMCVENGHGKLPFVFCKRGSLFSLVGK